MGIKMIETSHKNVMALWGELDKLYDRNKEPFTPEQFRIVRFLQAMLACLSNHVTEQDWLSSIETTKKTIQGNGQQ